MLIPGSRPDVERTVPPGRRVAGTGSRWVAVAGRRLVRRIAPAVALAGAISVPLAAAAPASADQPRQRQQWVLAALDVPAAWHITHGRGVTVAVIDSGVDPTVSDLTGSVARGPNLTGVGTLPSNPNWGAHGTWMASLIAGHGHGKGNSDGILGVAPQSRILSIRAITDPSDPGYHKYRTEAASLAQLQLARAIRYAVSHKVGVISMSLGYQASSAIVRAALQNALAHNIVVVASSGNSGQTTTAPVAPYSFPADYPGVIGVAAVSETRQPAYFSSENLSVQVAAPGVNVPAQGRGGKYWLVSGTSPACALTAGVAALIKSKYPRLSAAQIRTAITLSASHPPKAGYDDQVGFGIVDAAAALRTAGRLARQVPAGSTPAGKAAASGHFGHGQSGVPPFPVPRRGRGKLLVLLGASAACLLIVIAALWWFIAGRRRRKTAPVRGPGPTGPPAMPGAAGSGIGAGTGLYPTQIYPVQPYRQGRLDASYLSQPPGQLPAGHIPPAQAGYALPGSGTPPPQAGYPSQFDQPIGSSGQLPPPGSRGAYPAQAPGGQAQPPPSSPTGPLAGLDRQSGQGWRSGPTLPGSAELPSYQPSAPSLPASRDDDEWWFDHDDRPRDQPSPSAPPTPATGQWSSGLSERLEAAARARRQAEADASDAAERTVLAEAPAVARPEPATDPGAGMPPAAGVQPAAEERPAGSWAFERPGDALGPASTTSHRTPDADSSWRSSELTSGTQRGAAGDDLAWPGTASAAGVDQPAATAYRSAWEPVVKNPGASPSSAPAEPRLPPGPPPPAPLGSAAPTWQPGLSRQPATMRRTDQGGRTAPTFAEPAQDPSGQLTRPRYRPSTGISRQPADGLPPSASPPPPSGAPPSGPPLSSGAPPSGPSAPAPPTVAPLASGPSASAPSTVVPSASGPPTSAPPSSGPPSSGPPSSGPAPLPRRQPQTHLAAPLRRPRPARGEWQQAQPSQPLPSIWDIGKPSVSAEQAASSSASEPRDDSG